MQKSIVWAFALLTLYSHTLYANNILKDDFISIQAKPIVNDIIVEANEKLGINIYVISSNEKLEQNANLFEYTQAYESNLSKPYVVLVFVPRSQRVGLIPSSKEMASLYDASDVKAALIDVVASADKNKLEDKYNIGIVQGVSELAEQIAHSKGVVLTKVIPNDTKEVINIFRYIVYIGTGFVIWIFMFRPLLRRFRDGDKQ
ncbi:MAG: hypothetical protein JXQ76_13435 [Campylobacterales bacterium]|nr:hypothetical protein [Campylobacterales bacterium]